MLSCHAGLPWLLRREGAKRSRRRTAKGAARPWTAVLDNVR